MTANQFYVPRVDTQDGRVFLAGPEHRHLARAARVREGEEVILLDAGGIRYRAVVVKITPAGTELEVKAALEPEPVRFRLRLVQALLPARKMEFVLQKAAEVGASEIVLVETARSVGFPSSRAAGKRRRWEAIIREAVKQSKGATLTALHPPCKLEELLARDAAGPSFVLSEHGGRLFKEALAETAGDAAASDRAPGLVTIAVGPEGGWTKGEMERFETGGYMPVWLGPRLLRTETAALAGLFLAAHYLNH